MAVLLGRIVEAQEGTSMTGLDPYALVAATATGIAVFGIVCLLGTEWVARAPR
jgi:hypothetical protein